VVFYLNKWSHAFEFLAEKLELNTLQVQGQLYIPSINWLLSRLCWNRSAFLKSQIMEQCLWFSYHLMHDYDNHIIEFLLNNEKVKLYFMVPLITILANWVSFLAANITKFTEGGYVTLIIALLLISVMFIWYSAKNK
jgi:KUP system potassium uptake protein